MVFLWGRCNSGAWVGEVGLGRDCGVRRKTAEWERTRGKVRIKLFPDQSHILLLALNPLSPASLLSPQARACCSLCSWLPLSCCSRVVSVQIDGKVATAPPLLGLPHLFCPPPPPFKKMLFIYSFIYRKRGRKTEKHQCVVTS